MIPVSAPRVLHVDLALAKHWVEEVDAATLDSLLGARGLNARILWESVSEGTDPLGPENVLIFGAGTLCGTHAPSAGRTTVTTKSPATGLYLKSSVGGHWGPELKRAGYCALVLHGRCEVPSLLVIQDGDVRIHDASSLWGKDVRETTTAIRNLYGDGLQIACIGPAGENLVKFASLMFNTYNAAGRGGTGAVMGSKNLKAIAVKGTGALSVARPREFHEYVVDLRHKLAADTGSKNLSEYGTAGIVMTVNEIRALTSYNFQKGYIEGAEKISGQYLRRRGYLKRRIACDACGTGCHRYTTVDSGRYAGSHSGGPEFETLAALGSGCGVTDTETVLKANEMCNLLGMDSISAGSVVQWAMESWQRGLLSASDTGGLDLTWGNGETLIALLRQIAERRGLGANLADGVKAAAERLGGDSWKWAVQAKGLEQSRVETRLRFGYALAFAVNPRGPDHLMTEVVAESARTPEARALVARLCGSEDYATPYTTEKRAELVVWHEDCYAVTDALGLCAFATTLAYAVSPESMARMYSLALGRDMSEEEIMRAGRRIVNLEKCFNVREGATRADDKLPWRMMYDPVKDGPKAGLRNSPELMNAMLDDYYGLHGWDLATGWPRRGVLEDLGLAEQAKRLCELGRLPE
jgi:aldehyde:ferredoxin oxidoreductase